MLSATLEFLADGALKPADLAKRLKAGSGDTTRYLERLGDAVEKGPDGRYRIVDSVFASWIRWRRPGGAVVPMSLVGDAAERAVAVHLAQLGFDLVYQSRASRGAFDLLATRGVKHLGIQVKRSRLPLRFKKTEWRRMEADSARLGWAWAIAAVGEDDSVVMLDPGCAATKREVRVGPDAEIENLLTWLEASFE